jgi:hypothetical protein
MEIEEIKKKIQFAIDSVNNFPEPYRLKAFEVILAKSLEELSEKEPLHPIHERSSIETSPLNIGEKIEKLAKDANITIEQLKDVFDFKENVPIFISKAEGKEASEKQVQISELVLLVMHEVYEQEWLASSFLWQVLQECGVGSLDNFAANLSQRTDLFRAMGKKRGRKYRLTGPGKTAALELLKRLARP